jgi:hypothetical protein
MAEENNNGGDSTLLSSQGGDGQGQGQQQQQQQQASSISHGDWLTDGKFTSGLSGRLSDDLKPYAGLVKKFEGVSIQDVIRSHGELEKKLGQRVQPPGPEAKEEEIAAWRKLVGAPEKADGYEIKRPDDIPEAIWSDELANGFKQLAHKHHLPPSVAADMVNWWNGQQKAALSNLQQQAEAEVHAMTTELQKEWGERFQANILGAQRVAALAKLDVNDPAIGNNPAVIRALHAMSALVSEDRQVSGGNGNGPSLTAAQQADDIQTNKSNPYYDDYQGKNGPERQAAAAEKIRKLRESAQGNRAA